MRIAQAVQASRWNTGRALQDLRTRSFSAKLRAVKQGTSHPGRATPGIDGGLWQGARIFCLRRRGDTPKPLRRVYSPKKNGKKRPLAFPTVYDRAMPAVDKLALAPVAETTADRHADGCREGRRCAEAVAAACKALSKPTRQRGGAKRTSRAAMTTAVIGGGENTSRWTVRFFASGWRPGTSKTADGTQRVKERRRGEHPSRTCEPDTRRTGAGRLRCSAPSFSRQRRSLRR